MQNILFPIMEKKIPSTRPLTVLWSLHDDCKALMDKILSHLKQPETDEKLLNKQIGEFYFLLMVSFIRKNTFCSRLLLIS